MSRLTSTIAAKYADRVNKITERLNDLHSNIEQEKFVKLEQVETKVNNVDDQIIEWHEGNNKKFNTIKDKIQEFQKYIEEDQQNKDTYSDTRT